MSKPITKRCEFNRYCLFVGQFCAEHMLEIGRGRPRLVGRCGVCEGYVCNRCASRRPVEGVPAGGRYAAWELLCPLDGELLGRGDDWVVFSEQSAAVSRPAGKPGLGVLYKVLAETQTPTGGREEWLRLRRPLIAALRLLEDGRYAEAVDACEQARELTPDHAVVWLALRRALEESGRAGEAWSALRNFLYLADETVSAGMAELGWLEEESGCSLDSYAKELCALGASRDAELCENLSHLPGAGSAAARADNLKTASPGEDGGGGTSPASGDAAPDGLRMLCSYLASTRPTEQAQLPPETPPAHLRARSSLDPEYGHVIAEAIPQGAESALILLCHEHKAAGQQQNIYRQLEHILQKEPSALIMLEGFGGPRAKPRAVKEREGRIAAALRTLEKEGELAGAVLASLYPVGANIVGADDASLLAAQKEQAEIAAKSFGSSERAFVLSPAVNFKFPEFVLDSLERGSYGSAIQNFHQLRAQFHKSGAISTYVRGLQAVIKKAGVALDDYPSTFMLIKAMEMEAELDFQQVEQERLKLVETLADLGFAQLPDDQAAALDRWVERAPAEETALLQLYPNLLRAEEPRPQKKSRWWWPFKSGAAAEPERPADVTPAWFNRLLILSTAFRDNAISSSFYYYRLDGLLDCLGIEIQPRSLLGLYIDYMILASLVDVSSLATFELPTLESDLRVRLCRSAQDYGAAHLHREFYDLLGLIRLKLPAERVRPVLRREASFARWAGDALRLEAYVSAGERSTDFFMSQARSFTARYSATVEAALPEVIKYYTLALRRSEELINNATRPVGDSVPVRVLVCGRFHAYEALRAARRLPRLSLMVVAPFPKGDCKDVGRKQEGWKYFDEEDAMLPVPGHQSMQ